MNMHMIRAFANRRVLMAAALFCVPTVAIMGVRVLGPLARPKGAEAQVSAPAPAATHTGPDMHVSEHDAALMNSFHALEDAAKDRLAVGIATAVPVAQPRDSAPQSTDLPSSITLSSLMKSGGVSVAVMQGKLYRQGDRVTPEWAVAVIDDKAGEVTLQHVNGSQRVLSMKPRGR